MNLKVYKDDFYRELDKVIQTVNEQECATNLGTIELIALAELMETPILNLKFLWRQS